MFQASYYYRRSDGTLLASLDRLADAALVEISAVDYDKGIAAFKAANDRARAAEAAARDEARQALATKLGLTLDELALLGR